MMHIKYDVDNKIDFSRDEKHGIIIRAKEPKIVVVNEFTEKSAKLFREEFAQALSTEQDVVPIVIDSYGGYVDSLLSMVDIVKASSKPVITITTGKAMSCGSVLFTCGSKRYVGEYSRIMIHDVAAGAWGKVGELKVSVKESERLNTMIYKIMEDNIGKGRGYLSKIVEKKNRDDWYLTAKQAKKHGIATDIGIPKLTVSISLKMKFECK